MNENNASSNTNKLNTLAPTVDKETYGHYCDQLKNAIENLFDSNKDKIFYKNGENKKKISINLISQLSSKDALSNKAIQNFNDLFSKIGLHKNNIVKKS